MARARVLTMVFAVALAGCTNSRRVSSGDAAPDGSTCQRPAGSCLNETDCTDGMRCDRPALTENDDPDCTPDPCQFAGSIGSSIQALVPTDQQRQAPTLRICLGTCVAPKCANNADCDDGWYCDFGSACRGEGVCHIKPTSCGGASSDEPWPAPDGGSDKFAPPFDGGTSSDSASPLPDAAIGPMPEACGCDGKTYFSACQAAAAGVSVAFDGQCEACSRHANCPPGQYCHLENGCLAEGLVGRCAPVRDPNTCPDIATCAFVCGCDGETYCSSCDAETAGTNIAYAGKCQPDPECVNIDCVVHNDCCDCLAAPDIDLPPSCPAACENFICEGRAMPSPAAYCLNGHCLLTDNSQPCASDADCYLVNDCCNCTALPTYAMAETCDQTCYVPKCTQMGIDDSLPRCINDQCQLQRKPTP